MKTSINLWFIALTLAVSGLGAGAQGTAFTYQGRLNDGASPANGTYDLRFAIYDSTNNPGVLIAGPVTNSAATVSNGLFTATLDFGNVFDGTARFLEIAVRTNGGVSFVVLTPRQALTPTPYAIFANSASNLLGALSPSQLSGIYSNPVNFNNGADSFSGTFLGQFYGSSFTGGNFTGNFLGTGSGLYDVWHTAGNAGTTAASFLGTTDNQPLILKVNGQETMRYEASPETPNIIGGWSGNYVQSNLTGVTIGGGGSPNPFAGKPQPNVVTNGGFYGVIAGGYNNMVTNYGGTILGGSVNLSGGNFATIGGGQFHTNLGYYSVVGGGYQNLVLDGAGYSVIGGGYLNQLRAYGSVIGGGLFHVTGTNAPYSVIGGGYANIMNGYLGTIGGGWGNTEESYSGTIGGGLFNTIGTNSEFSFIGGGDQNTNQSFSGYSVIGGGLFSTIQTNAGYSVIGGGLYNNVHSFADQSVIAGGNANNIEFSARESFVGGGFANNIEVGALGSFVGAGFANTNASGISVIVGGNHNIIQTNAATSFIGGGVVNTIRDNAGISFIGGGAANTAAGFLSTSVGGQGNAAMANNSTMVGGLFNTNFGVLAFVGGGDNNFAAGFGSVISGGESNRTGGSFSMAAGYHANALQHGTFVWADFQPANFSSTSTNQFLIRAQSGVGINTNNPQAALHVNGDIIANNFLGSGASLNGLNFSQLTGTLLDAQLSGTYSGGLTFNNVGNSFTGNGAGLTSLNASNLSSGTVADARLTTNVALLNRDPQTFTGQNNFSGNIVMTDPTKTILFPPTAGANTSMITMFASGTGNADRMVIAHSPGFQNYGLQYQDFSDRFNFTGNGIAMTIDLNSRFVGINNSNPTNMLMVSNARCDGSTWINASDRNLKENFEEIDQQTILAKVLALPIARWNYKTDATSVHLGPVAQDFHAAFQLGADDRSIATVDESGVALAAIQGLNQKLEAQRGELKQKETEIAELKQRLDKLEQLMSSR
jgi:hypothetical protein